MIVKPAGFRRYEIQRLATLPGYQRTQVDLDAIGVLGMWIGRHVVTPRIVIHEEHTGAERNRQFLRRHSARGEGEGVRIRWRSRRRWCGVAAST